VMYFAVGTQNINENTIVKFSTISPIHLYSAAALDGLIVHVTFLCVLTQTTLTCRSRPFYDGLDREIKYDNYSSLPIC